MSLTVQNPHGSILIGKRSCDWKVTDAGELVFPCGSRAEAMGIVEAINRHINQHTLAEVKALPTPVANPVLKSGVSAAVESKTEEPNATVSGRKLAKDGTLRGRPPKPKEV